MRHESASDGEQETVHASRKPGGRAIAVLLTVGVFSVFIGSVVWASMDNAPSPQYQRLVTMQNMQPHPVSLWLDPKPHRTGQGRLTAQVADGSGSPITLKSLDFSVTAPGQSQSVVLPGEYTSEGPLNDFLGNSPAYSAPIQLTVAGTWLIEVRFSLGGMQQSDSVQRTTFQIDVGG